MRFPISAAGLVGAAAILFVASHASASDAYAPLLTYAGKWSVVTDHGKVVAVVNSCARAGLFFGCEQSIDGAPKAVVVFLPVAANEGGGRYRTQTLGADGAEPGHWFSLTIKDADWVYTPEGGEPRERTLNHFVDTDHIHFDIQKKTGDAWKTTLGGDETRAK